MQAALRDKTRRLPLVLCIVQKISTADRIRTTALTEIEINKLREECGVFGIYGHPEAARLTYLGLYALQHRGQESCGIVASDAAELRLERKMGHVSEAFETQLGAV